MPNLGPRTPNLGGFGGFWISKTPQFWIADPRYWDSNPPNFLPPPEPFNLASQPPQTPILGSKPPPNPKFWFLNPEFWIQTPWILGSQKQCWWPHGSESRQLLGHVPAITGAAQQTEAELPGKLGNIYREWSLLHPPAVVKLWGSQSWAIFLHISPHFGLVLWASPWLAVWLPRISVTPEFSVTQHWAPVAKIALCRLQKVLRGSWIPWGSCRRGNEKAFLSNYVILIQSCQSTVVHCSCFPEASRCIVCPQKLDIWKSQWWTTEQAFLPSCRSSLPEEE